MENIISAQKISGFNFDDPSRGYTGLSKKIFVWIYSRRSLLSTEQNGPSGLMKFPPVKIAFGPARLNSANFLANDEATVLWRQWHIALAATKAAEAQNFRSRLIEFCMPMIKATARRCARWSGGLAAADLEQEGFLGLHAALHGFNPKYPSTFKAYARRRITGAMLDAIRRWRRGTSQLTRTVSRRQSLETFLEIDSSEELLGAIATGLNGRQRQIVELCALQEMNYRGAGKLLGLHATRVGQIYRQSLNQLRTNPHVRAVLSQ